MPRAQTIRLLKIIGVILAVIIIVGYAIWRSLDYARGPRITILEPPDGAGIASSSVMLVAQAERVNNISLNGRGISMDEQGNIRETLVIFPGLNLITIRASDQFGREITRELQLVGLEK